MKEKFKNLLKKHKLSRNSYYQSSPYKQEVGQCSKGELALLENWSHHVAKGWYGISLGQPTPDSWFRFLDAFLRLVRDYNPNFEIHQIKMKFGGLRCYLGNINEETRELVSQVEEIMYDDELIY